MQDSFGEARMYSMTVAARFQVRQLLYIHDTHATKPSHNEQVTHVFPDFSISDTSVALSNAYIAVQRTLHHAAEHPSGVVLSWMLPQARPSTKKYTKFQRALKAHHEIRILKKKRK